MTIEASIKSLAKLCNLENPGPKNIKDFTEFVFYSADKNFDLNIDPEEFDDVIKNNTVSSYN